MPGRATAFANQEFYHLFNRGSEKRDIFQQNRDYIRFIKTLYYYQFIGPKPSFSKFSKSDLNSFKPDLDKRLVEIICYCLMPNHFHFLVRQLRENGVSMFMSQLANSYTKYFNTKYTRVGALLQGAFKAVLMETDEQLIHLSRYIHLNPIVSSLTEDINSYKWSSYPEYITGQNIICSTQEVLNFFPSIEHYQEFTEAQIEYGTTLEILKHSAIDFDQH